MEDDNDLEHRMLLGWILGIAVTLSIAVALLSGIVATTRAPAAGGPTAAAPAAPASAAPATAAPAADAPAAAAPSAAAPSVVAAVTTLRVVKVFFASGAVALPADAAAELAPLVDAARAASAARLSVSGYHDKTGDPARNAELAKQRAFAVRDALVAAGVAVERIELRKPQETTGDGDDREARRVEVSLD